MSDDRTPLEIFFASQSDEPASSPAMNTASPTDDLLTAAGLTAAERAESERIRAELAAMPIGEVVKMVQGSATIGEAATIKPWKDRLYLSGATWGDEGMAMQSEINDLRAARAASAEQSARPTDDDMAKVLAEVNNARANWPPFNSAHEGFAILLEEVDELKAHVWTNQKRRDLPAMRKEAMQVAAMALRFMGECCDETTGRK